MIATGSSEEGSARFDAAPPSMGIPSYHPGRCRGQRIWGLSGIGKLLSRLKDPLAGLG